MRKEMIFSSVIWQLRSDSVSGGYQEEVEGVVDDQVDEVGVLLDRREADQVQQHLAGGLLGHHQRASGDHGDERLDQEEVLLVVGGVPEAEVVDVCPGLRTGALHAVLVVPEVGLHDLDHAEDRLGEARRGVQTVDQLRAESAGQVAEQQHLRLFAQHVRDVRSALDHREDQPHRPRSSVLRDYLLRFFDALVSRPYQVSGVEPL